MMSHRRKLTICASVLIALTGAALALHWTMYSSFSLAIRTKGRRACQNRRPCIVRLSQVFPGDWDHVLIFNVGASQNEIDKTVGRHIKRPDLQRLIVFMHGANVIRTLTESEGFEHPFPATVLFDRVQQTLNHQLIQRDWNFVMGTGAPDCGDCTTLSRIMPGEVVE
jgi:hypothetical protein